MPFETNPGDQATNYSDLGSKFLCLIKSIRGFEKSGTI